MNKYILLALLGLGIAACKKEAPEPEFATEIPAMSEPVAMPAEEAATMPEGGAIPPEAMETTAEQPK